MFGHLNGDEYDTCSFLPYKRVAADPSRFFSISQMTESDNWEYKNTNIKETDNISTVGNKSQIWTIKVPNRVKPKTVDQLMYLEKQFANDPSWSKKTINQWAKVLNLSRSQIYKWGYNKRNAVAAPWLATSKNSSLFVEFPCLLKLRDIKDMNKQVDEIIASVKEPVTNKDEWLVSIFKNTSNNLELNDGTESTSSCCFSTRFKAHSAIVQERRSEESIFDTFTENNDLFSISPDFNPVGNWWDEFKSEKVRHSVLPSLVNYTIQDDTEVLFTELNSVQKFDAVLDHRARLSPLNLTSSQLDFHTESEFSNYLFK